ncbi:gp110 [Sphingomonas phage PAU]|uniref:gp110 n=1 Tax=Sphingomonas phage PAU TaxID=1150991 RepID=UPI0002573261|nr:gp110 [Sphingomonas phage PAU]AFF28108.1 gp110 [Sphingomonas phage PAU]
MPHRYERLKEKFLDPEKLKNVSNEELQEIYNEFQALMITYKTRQMSVKLSANSLYGASGNQHYRFANYEVASDITGEGAYHMIAIDKALNKYLRAWDKDLEIQKILKEKFPEQDFKFVPIDCDVCNYGDTDSRYIEYGKIFKACNFVPKSHDDLIDFVKLMDVHRVSPLFEKVLTAEVTRKNGNSTMKMELEVMGGRGIFLAKKMYVMSVIWKDGRNVAKAGKIKATGVELKRKTSSLFAKKMQERVIRALLTPTFPVNDVYRLAAGIVQHAKTLSLDELCRITKVSKYHEFVIDDKENLILAKGSRPPQKGSARWNHLLYKHGVLDKYEPLYDGRLKWYLAEDGQPMAIPLSLDSTTYPDWLPKINHAAQIEAIIIKPLQRYLPENASISNLGKSVIQNSFGN